MKNVTNTLRKCVAIMMMATLLLASLPLTALAADEPLTPPLVCKHTEDGDPLECELCIAERKALKAGKILPPAPAASTQLNEKLLPAGQTEADSLLLPSSKETGDAANTKTTETTDSPPTDTVPGTPVDPDNPDDPETPGNPQIPGTPGDPATPGGPQGPSGPEGPDTPAPPALSISVVGLSVPEGAALGTQTTITARLEGVGVDAVPTGSIVFAVDGKTLSASVAGSSATADWTPATGGDVSITARYVPGSADAYLAGGEKTTTIPVAGDVMELPGTTDDAAGDDPPAGDDLPAGAAALPQTLDTVLAAAYYPPVDLTGGSIVVNAGALFYTGQAHTPGVTVRLAGGSTVSNGYLNIQYTNNINAGTANVTVTPYNGTGTLSGSFTISQANTTGWTVQWPQPAYTTGSIPYYLATNGATADPKPTVAFGGLTLTEGVDYTVSHSNNTVGSTNALATVTPTGNFTGGNRTYTFGVAAPATFTVTITAGQETAYYTGYPIAPGFSVQNGGLPVNVSEYTSTYINNTEVGTGQVVVTARSGATITGTQIAEFTILPRQTATTVTAGAYGSGMVLTATVGGGVNPTGVVEFDVTDSNGPSIYTAQVSGGRAQTGISAPNGAFTVVARYSGDRNHDPSAGQTSVTDNMATVSVTVHENGVYGQYVTLRIRVSGLLGGRTPTGDVLIRIGGRQVDRVHLDAYGEATYSLWNQQWGNQTVIVDYQGDGYYSPASSGEVRIWDSNKRIPTIKLDTAVGSGSKPTTLTATVGGTYWYDRPTGHVTFYSGEKILGAVRLDRRGEATYTWQNVPNGTHTVYAVYSGDTNYRGITAEKKITKRASSSGSGSTSTQSVPAQTLRPNDALLRDDNGNVLATYDTTTIQMQTGGVLRLETTQNLNYYSLGIPLARLRQLASSQTGGYLNFVTPSFNLNIGYGVAASGMADLSGYLTRNGLTEAQTELRISVRKIDDSSLSSAFASAHSGSTPVAMYRVEFSLYNSEGKKLDYTPADITTPVNLILPITGSVGIAEGYDETTRTFFPVAAEFGDGTADLTVDQNGIYIVGTASTDSNG